MIHSFFEAKIDQLAYRKQSPILKDIDIQLASNGLYGFFGKNGQGKTTLFKAFAGLKRHNGNIRLNQTELLPQDVAWIATEPELYLYLTAHEFYDFFAKVSGRKNRRKPPIFEMDHEKLIIDYSTGMRRKVQFNSILQFDDYRLYIFDEPFNGLDVESTYQLLTYIQDLAKHHLVFISSHIIEIIAPYLTKAFVLKDTKVVEVDTHQIKSSL